MLSYQKTSEVVRPEEKTEYVGRTSYQKSEKLNLVEQKLKNLQDELIERTKYQNSLSNLLNKYNQIQQELDRDKLLSYHQNDREKTEVVDNKQYLLEVYDKTLIKSQEVNKFKKQDNNIQIQLNTIKQIKQNLMNDSENYITLLKNYDNTQKIVEQITQPLPDEIINIKPDNDQGLSHCIIEKPEKKIYSYHNETIKGLIESYSYLWKSLKLKYEMNEENREKLIEDLLFNFQNLNQDLYNKFKEKIKKGFDYKILKLNILKEYTHQSYYINNKLITDDPIKLSAMSQYLNLAIKAYEDGDVGQPYENYQLICRNIKLAKNLISLYKQESYVYFTGMTSASKADQEKFSEPDKNHYGVKFVIKLLDIQLQKKNKRYSGLELEKISYFPHEKEVLILPYQLFQIKQVIPYGSDRYQIYLDEIDNKTILDEIRKPLIKTIQNSQPFNKNKFFEELTNQEKILKEKQKNAIKLMELAFNEFSEMKQTLFVKNKFDQADINKSYLLDQHLPSFNRDKAEEFYYQFDRNQEFQDSKNSVVPKQMNQLNPFSSKFNTEYNLNDEEDYCNQPSNKSTEKNQLNNKLKYQSKPNYLPNYKSESTKSNQDLTNLNSTSPKPLSKGSFIKINDMQSTLKTNSTLYSSQDSFTNINTTKANNSSNKLNSENNQCKFNESDKQNDNNKFFFKSKEIKQNDDTQKYKSTSQFNLPNNVQNQKINEKDINQKINSKDQLPNPTLSSQFRSSENINILSPKHKLMLSSTQNDRPKQFNKAQNT